MFSPSPLSRRCREEENLVVAPYMCVTDPRPFSVAAAS